jgi:hypothetical protein
LRRCRFRLIFATPARCIAAIGEHGLHGQYDPKTRTPSSVGYSTVRSGGTCRRQLTSHRPGRTVSMSANRMPTRVSTPSESAPAPTRDVSRLPPPVSGLASTHALSPRTPCGRAIRRHRHRHNRSVSTRISSVHGICQSPKDFGYSRSVPTALTDFTVKRATASHPIQAGFLRATEFGQRERPLGTRMPARTCCRLPAYGLRTDVWGLLHGGAIRWMWYYAGDMKCVLSLLPQAIRAERVQH